MNATRTVTQYGLKSVIRIYRNHVIQSFNVAQLLDKECKGLAYYIFANETDYNNGTVSLNVCEHIGKLWQAKMFVDKCVERNTTAYWKNKDEGDQS